MTDDSYPESKSHSENLSSKTPSSNALSDGNHKISSTTEIPLSNSSGKSLEDESTIENLIRSTETSATDTFDTISTSGAPEAAVSKKYIAKNEASVTTHAPTPSPSSIGATKNTEALVTVQTVAQSAQQMSTSTIKDNSRAESTTALNQPKEISTVAGDTIEITQTSVPPLSKVPQGRNLKDFVNNATKILENLTTASPPTNMTNSTIENAANPTNASANSATVNKPHELLGGVAVSPSIVIGTTVLISLLFLIFVFSVLACGKSPRQ